MSPDMAVKPTNAPNNMANATYARSTPNATSLRNVGHTDQTNPTCSRNDTLMAFLGGVYCAHVCGCVCAQI